MVQTTKQSHLPLVHLLTAQESITGLNTGLPPLDFVQILCNICAIKVNMFGEIHSIIGSVWSMYEHFYQNFGNF